MPTIQHTHSLRRVFRLILLVAAVGFGLKAFLLSPIYVRFASDVAFKDAFWVDILYFLTDGGFLDLAVFAVCYPATLYVIRFGGLKETIRVPIAYASLTFGKFIANYVVDSLVEGALPRIEEVLSFDLPFILGMYALEMLQYILVILIALLVRRLYENRVRVAAGMALLPRTQRVDYPRPPEDFPFTQIYTRRNALQRGALLSSAVVTLGRIIMHLVYQITLFVGFGSSEGWVVMLIDLVGDLIIGAVFYFVALLIMMNLRQKEPAETSAQ